MVFMILQMVLIMNLKISTGHSRVELLASTILVLFIYYELVKIEEGRFYLRNKGKELADAVRNSIDENIRKLFLKCILDGSLKEEAIEDLQSLAIHRIIVGSEEWLFLNNLLTKSDEDSSLAKRNNLFAPK